VYLPFDSITSSFLQVKLFHQDWWSSNSYSIIEIAMLVAVSPCSDTKNRHMLNVIVL
jgi:hypothetical protein